jgi:hypothetical protein
VPQAPALAARAHGPRCLTGPPLLRIPGKDSMNKKWIT